MFGGNRNIAITLTLATMLAMGISACGRKGPLEPPSGTLTGSSDKVINTEKSDIPERKFILDGLI